MGFVAIVRGLLSRFSNSGDGFPLTGDLAIAVAWETPITFCSLPVVLTSVGLVLVFMQVRQYGESPFYRHIILPLSQAGYGMYLIHMLVLAQFSALYRNWLGVGAAGLLGYWTTPVEILATALSSFVVVGVLAVALQRIPKVGKYLMG
jgi:surface polysaccharide O-acyltransferase-like enzyme